MKIKNKKTGEIGNLIIDKNLLVIRTSTAWEHYSSLAELNEEWEDYEEPKTFFTIYYDGTISEFTFGDDEQIRDMKAIGNYFETEEEAEQAVEKLKAWKRLKDKGFRFDCWDNEDRATIHDFVIYCRIKDLDNINRDLDFLFGGGQ